MICVAARAAENRNVRQNPLPLPLPLTLSLALAIFLALALSLSLINPGSQGARCTATYARTAFMPLSPTFDTPYLCSAADLPAQRMPLPWSRSRAPICPASYLPRRHSG